MAIRMPPSAGPPTAAVCQASEFQAMALGKLSRGTSMGPSAVEAGEKKDRVAPNTAATTQQHRQAGEVEQRRGGEQRDGEDFPGLSRSP